MLECIVLGDSIAVGIGSVSPQCQTIARVGINSKNFVVSHKYIPSANITIISLGANDGNANFTKYLISLRNKISGRVIWVLPANNSKARSIAMSIALKRGDGTVQVTNTVDGVHPKSYKSLANKIF